MNNCRKKVGNKIENIYVYGLGSDEIDENLQTKILRDISPTIPMPRNYILSGSVNIAPIIESQIKAQIHE